MLVLGVVLRGEATRVRFESVRIVDRILGDEGVAEANGGSALLEARKCEPGRSRKCEPGRLRGEEAYHANESVLELAVRTSTAVSSLLE